MAPLYGRITLNGKRAEFSIKRYVLPEHWDVSKGQPVRRKGKEKELAAYLESIRTKLYRHQRDFQDQNRSYSALDLKEALQKPSQNTFSIEKARPLNLEVWRPVTAGFQVYLLGMNK